MLSSLKALFATQPAETAAARQHRLHLVAAALLIETSRADFTQSVEEDAALATLLAGTLDLTQTEVHDLIAAAQTRVDHATSLYEFTRVINDHYSAQEKLTLIGDMWKVAYADGDLDKYEEHLIRQVAELIYIPHSDYIRSKLGNRP